MQDTCTENKMTTNAGPTLRNKPMNNTSTVNVCQTCPPKKSTYINNIINDLKSKNSSVI
jgi:protein-arginine kinase activator protein McsA